MTDIEVHHNDIYFVYGLKEIINDAIQQANTNLKKIAIYRMGDIPHERQHSGLLLIRLGTKNIEDHECALHIKNSISVTKAKIIRILRYHTTHVGTATPPHDPVLEKLRELTPKEILIMQLILTYQNSSLLSDALGIRTKTLNSHRASIMRKLGFRNRIELIKFTIESELEINSIAGKNIPAGRGK